MKKLNLTAQKICDNEFKPVYKGYDPEEVDKFLDLIIEDYQINEENVKELVDYVSSLQEELETLQSKNRELRKDVEFNLNQTTSYSNVDLLKRLSRLEAAMFNVDDK